jgi:hypothetical protein
MSLGLLVVVVELAKRSLVPVLRQHNLDFAILVWVSVYVSLHERICVLMSQ